MSPAGRTQRWPGLWVATGFFILFVGIGRILSLVTHDPLLGYANSYDMIRLQACHQIWPADKAIDITDGTPAAPLRRYTLGKQVDTPCFPSSELLFTAAALEIAQAKNRITGEKLVSMRTVGTVKAGFLAVTALLASLYFYRRQMMAALLANGIVMALVLADPGVTLYLNSFYTEFSAVYFLYLALIGIVVVATSPARFAWSLPLLAGLLGLGLSKPQHLPLALLLGLLAGAWLWRQRLRRLAVMAVLCGALPVLLQATGHWTPRNDNMALANKVNVLGALLPASPDAAALLASLALPPDCATLSGKNWYDADIQRNRPCQALAQTSHTALLLASLQQPVLLGTLLQESIPPLAHWVFPLYGQVEGKTYLSASEYQASIGHWLETLPAPVFTALWWLPLPLSALWLLYCLLSGRQCETALFAGLLVVIQWTVFAVALFGDGHVDLAKHAHLGTGTVLAFYSTALSLWAHTLESRGC